MQTVSHRKVIPHLLSFSVALVLLVSLSQTASAGRSAPREASKQLLEAKRIFYRLNSLPWEDRDMDLYQDVIRKAEAVKRAYPDTDLAEAAQNLIIRCHDTTGDTANMQRALAEHLDNLERQEREKEAKAYIRAKADESYGTGRYNEAMALFEFEQERYGRDDEDVRGRCAFRIARSYFKIGQSLIAEKKYREILKSKLPEKWEKKTLIGLGYLLMVENKQNEALKEFQTFLKKYPNDHDASYAQLMIGEALRLTKDNAGAVLAYQGVVKNYPKSKWSKLAKRRASEVMDEVMNDLTHGLDIMDIGD